MQQKGGEYEESGGKPDHKGMAWTVVKNALCSESFFQIVVTGQQQWQGFFSLEWTRNLP